MATTYGMIRTGTLRLLDEFSSRGSILAANKVADYNFKIQQICNESIYELASTNSKLPKTFLIAHNPIKNALSDDTSSIKQHLSNIDFSITLTNARSCFLEATYPGVMILEESSNGGVTYSIIETITVLPSVEGFKEYKRLINPSLPTNTVRLRFTGSYVYLFRNFVLYEYSFPTEDLVQQHRPHFVFNPPDDFLDLNYVEIKRDARQYVPYSNMIKTPDNKLSFNSYEFPAEFLVHYWRKPTLLTFTDVAVVDDAMLIDLRDDASLIISYNIAGTIQNSEEDNRGNGNLKKYNEKRTSLISSKSNSLSTIINNSGW